MSDPINKITPRTHTVTILQGDDEEHLRELRTKAERLAPKKGDPTPTMEDAAEHTAAVEAADEFAAEAEARGVKVILRAMGRKTWRDLIAKHPPRPDNEADKTLGANTEAFEDALVPLSIASPAFASDTDRDYFLDSLSVAQYSELSIVAWALNNGQAADPKALLGSGAAPN